MLSQTAEHHWTADHRMHLTRCREGDDITQSEGFKICRVCNKCYDVTRAYSIFVETMDALVSKAGAFELEYRALLVGTRMKDVFDDTLSSEYLVYIAPTYNIYGLPSSV